MAVKMLDEHLTGVGDVSVKKTGKAVGAFRYALTISGEETQLTVNGFDAITARQLQEKRTRLVLAMEDGRAIEFFVDSFHTGAGDYSVTALGGPRPQQAEDGQ